MTMWRGLVRVKSRVGFRGKAKKKKVKGKEGKGKRRGQSKNTVLYFYSDPFLPFFVLSFA